MLFLATAAFGLEGLVARELRDMHYEATATLGGAYFEGSFEDAFRANLYLRTADRVLLIVGRFPAVTFTELFEGVKSLPWEDYLSAHACFPVSGNCARSQLMSVSDCQAITKKAIVERLRSTYRLPWFPEDRETVPISVTLHANEARLSIDTSGTALNRRGYRTWNGEAPLRETAAAALALLSPWRPSVPLYDPFCGTGTLLVESAMIMSGKAPGLERSFAMESFPGMDKRTFETIREQARAEFRPEQVGKIHGSDIDPGAVELAKRHIRQAGFSGHISVSVLDVRDCMLPEEKGVFLCNPPYGERLQDKKSCEILYAEIGKLASRHPGWTLCAITSHAQFERCIRRRADKKRRLYNGRLECEFMTFYPRNR